jgi:hypothetical protein
MQTGGTSVATGAIFAWTVVEIAETIASSVGLIAVTRASNAGSTGVRTG